MYLGVFPLYVNLKWGSVGALSGPGSSGDLVTAQTTWGKVICQVAYKFQGVRLS